VHYYWFRASLLKHDGPHVHELAFVDVSVLVRVKRFDKHQSIRLVQPCQLHYWTDQLVCRQQPVAFRVQVLEEFIYLLLTASFMHAT